MEGGGWSARLRVVTLLACLALAQGSGCRETQYRQDQRCCSRCPPGQKVQAECSAELDTACVPCGDHHFQDRWTREHHCTPHRTCDEKAGLMVHLSGNQERDVVCRCQEGTHCSSPECQTCRPHSRLCGPGEGVLQDANHENDTLCVPCPRGFYSSVASSTARCQPWSSCEEDGLVPAVNGTQAADVICGRLPAVDVEARQTHLLVIPPLALLFLLGGLLLFWHQHGKCSRKRRRTPEPPEPTENEEGCPAFPTQETLLGEQIKTQENGKDCHLAQQEQA